MNTPSNGFSWTFKRHFHFESNGSMEQVVHSLGRLGDPAFSGSPNNEIFFEREGEGYTFHYRIQHETRQRSKISLSTTAFSEGRIWKAQDGHIIVEGHTQIEPLRAYYFTGVYAFLACVCLSLVQGVYVVIPLIFAGLVGFNIMSYYSAYYRAGYGVAEAVANTHNMPENLRTDVDKTRRPSDTEKVKNARDHSQTPVNPNNVWHDAISEYDNSR